MTEQLQQLIVATSDVTQAWRAQAEAVERCVAVLEEAVQGAIEELVPAGRSIASVTWAKERLLRMSLKVVLDNGEVIRGKGPGKLEAIMAARRALG